MAKTAAFPNKGRRVKEYALAEGAAFLMGAAVVVAAGEADEAGADPAAIAGFALHDAGAMPHVDRVLIAKAEDGSTFFMEGDRAPTQADIGESYGLIKDADGIWIVDTTEETVTPAFIEDVDLTRGLFEVSIPAEYRQLAP